MTSPKAVSKKAPQSNAATEKENAVANPVEAGTPAAKSAIAKKLPVVKAPSKATTKRKNTIAVAKSSKPSPKEAKPKKVKLIRDSFTMPAFDYDLIARLKTKAIGKKLAVKKSELLRAGLHALNVLEPAQLVALVGTLSIVKAGRPKK